MLNPQKKLHRLLGKFFFRLPHNQRRWKECWEHYMPILDGVFIDNEAALLMIMRCLEKIESGDIEGAQRIIEALRPLFAANEKHPPVLVLWHVLHALHQSKSGHMAKMAANLRTANKLGHRYHIAHALYADDICHRLHFYDEAEEHFSKAVDCIYAWPPMTERARQVIGLLYTRIAYVRTMMHRHDEARDALRIAESMQAPPEALSHSRALRMPRSACPPRLIAVLSAFARPLQRQPTSLRPSFSGSWRRSIPTSRRCLSAHRRALRPSGRISSITRMR